VHRALLWLVIVICTKQKVESRSKTSSPAAPSKGKGGKGKAGKATLTSSSTKIELHLSATESASEVLYVEAWGEPAQQVQKKCSGR